MGRTWGYCNMIEARNTVIAVKIEHGCWLLVNTLVWQIAVFVCHERGYTPMTGRMWLGLPNPHGLPQDMCLCFWAVTFPNIALLSIRWWSTVYFACFQTLPCNIWLHIQLLYTPAMNYTPTTLFVNSYLLDTNPCLLFIAQGLFCFCGLGQSTSNILVNGRTSRTSRTSTSRLTSPVKCLALYPSTLQ